EMPIAIPRCFAAAIFLALLAPIQVSAQAPPSPPSLRVPACEDFKVTGRGENPAWNKAPWTSLNRRSPSARDDTARFKMLYSPKGLYVLFDGTDQMLTATKTADYDELWKEDVFECFF